MTALRFLSSRLAAEPVAAVVAALVAVCALAFAATAWAVAWDLPKDGMRPVPALTNPVTDLTGTLSASDVQTLDAKLRTWEAQTSNQLAVLIVPTTSPESIEDYSIRVADAWKIGQKGKDNGAIFLVAKDDKRMRIEVGYGFEGVLTDVTSRRIIAENVAPEFSKGNFAAGINAGVDRIIAVTSSGEPLEPVTSTPRRGPAPRHLDFGTLFIVLLVAAPILGGVLRSLFGKVGGSVVGGGVVGAIAWFVAASLLVAGAAGVIGFLIILFSGFSGRGGPGIFIPGGGGGFGGGGFGGGGGGFSGGGGGFGGGGASGGWN